jgi:hypothetical protein
MWGHFRRKEPDIGALQKALGRFKRSTRATRREDVVGVPGNAVRLGFIVLLTLLLTILLIWLRRRRTREEEAILTSPPPEEGVEGVEAAGLSAEEEAVVMPEGLPLAEGATVREEPPPGEERPERRGIIGRRIGALGWPSASWRRRGS